MRNYEHPATALRERFFGDVFRALEGFTRLEHFPRTQPFFFETALPNVHLEETNEAFLVEADLPGFTLEDVSLTLNGQTLGIRAESKQESSEQYQRQERRQRKLEREFRIPRSVDGERITASLTDGVLRISLPKKEQAKPRTIEINKEELSS